MNMRKFSVILALTAILGLVGCGSKDIKNTDTQLPNTKVEQEKKVEKEENKKEVQIENMGGKEEKAEKKESKKAEYKAKLDAIEIGLQDLKEKEAGTTQEMRAAANERYKRWDTALNEIYNELKKELSAGDMEKLKNEEIQWIAARDAKAKKASEEMKGGTMEPVLYVASLAETTRSRCYELVEKYMK